MFIITRVSVIFACYFSSKKNTSSHAQKKKKRKRFQNTFATKEKDL